MSGISSKAASGLENKKGYNGNELQNKEFSDGGGLELYDFNARTYDQQIGRFIQIDPETQEGDQESWTPYHFSFNNPVLNSDPDGRFPINGILKLSRIAYTIYKASDKLAAIKNVKLDDVIRAFSPITIDQASMAKSMRDLKVNLDKQLEDKSKARGSNNQKTKEAAETGQEAHRQEQAKLRDEGAETEVPMTLKDGTQVRKDAVREDGTTVIIKPDTQSGKRSAAKREELMKKMTIKQKQYYTIPKTLNISQVHLHI